MKTGIITEEHIGPSSVKSKVILSSNSNMETQAILTDNFHTQTNNPKLMSPLYIPSRHNRYGFPFTGIPYTKHSA